MSYNIIGNIKRNKNGGVSLSVRCSNDNAGYNSTCVGKEDRLAVDPAAWLRAYLGGEFKIHKGLGWALAKLGWAERRAILTDPSSCFSGDIIEVQETGYVQECVPYDELEAYQKEGRDPATYGEKGAWYCTRSVKKTKLVEKYLFTSTSGRWGMKTKANACRGVLAEMVGGKLNKVWYTVSPEIHAILQAELERLQKSEEGKAYPWTGYNTTLEKEGIITIEQTVEKVLVQ